MNRGCAPFRLRRWMAGGKQYPKKPFILRKTSKASFVCSPPSALTWVAQCRGTRKRISSFAPAMGPRTCPMELVSAGPHSGEWTHSKHPFRTVNSWCDSNISGNSWLTRKSLAKEGDFQRWIQPRKIKATFFLHPRREYGTG